MKKLAVGENVVTSIMIGSGVLAMFCLLVYTFWHTGGLLSRYVVPTWLGYVCAGGIELAVITLSAYLSQLRKGQQKTVWTVMVLGMVIAVSTLANVAEGYATRYDGQVTVLSLTAIDPVQATIGLASTGLISVIVFSLSNILASNVHGVRVAKPEVVLASQPIPQTISMTLPDKVETIVTQPVVELTKHEAKVLRHKWILEQGVPVTPEMLVKEFGIGLRTAYRDLDIRQSAEK